MDFHKSAMFNGKTVQVDTDLAKTSSLSNKFRNSPGDVDSSWPNESNNNHQQGGGAIASEGRSNSIMSSSNKAKRQRASSYPNSQISRCQVEGCNIDLSTAKDYHRRHRICDCHSKSPKVIVAGLERRFCQQCSRFHNLAEFDDKKRSCRRRLSDHNARRRRPQPGALHLSSVGLSSSIYERRPPSFLLNRLASSLSNTAWESSCSLRMSQTSGEVSAAVNPYLNEAPNLPRALSLLSATTTTSTTNHWGLNQPESTSLQDPFIQGNAAIAQPVMLPESQNWPVISVAHVSAEQAHSISPLQ